VYIVGFTDGPEVMYWIGGWAVHCKPTLSISECVMSWL